MNEGAETEPNPDDAPCSGACRHPKKFHKIKIMGHTESACSKMDCSCEKYVPPKMKQMERERV